MPRNQAAVPRIPARVQENATENDQSPYRLARTPTSAARATAPTMGTIQTVAKEGGRLGSSVGAFGMTVSVGHPPMSWLPPRAAGSSPWRHHAPDPRSILF